LHVASSHGLPRLVAKLLKNGAKVDQIDGRGWAPLARAVEGGHESVVRLLLENGAEADSKSKSLSIAATDKHERYESLTKPFLKKDAEAYPGDNSRVPERPVAQTNRIGTMLLRSSSSGQLVISS
jgi:ankyrin repeat protein